MERLLLQLASSQPDGMASGRRHELMSLAKESLRSQSTDREKFANLFGE